MKILTMLALMLFFAVGTAMATQSVTENVQFVAGPSDAEVKKLVMYMIKTYNLNPDQQLKVKEAAMKMASDAAAQKPLDAKKKEKLCNDFSLTMSNTLNTDQYAQYKSTLNQNYKLLDDIIDAATK
jgi:biopolymer transport protein ExbD